MRVFFFFWVLTLEMFFPKPDFVGRQSFSAAKPCRHVVFSAAKPCRHVCFLQADLVDICFSAARSSRTLFCMQPDLVENLLIGLWGVWFSKLWGV